MSVVGTQGRNWKQERMQRPREHCLLACFSKLAQLAFLQHAGPPSQRWYLPIYQDNNRFDYRPILQRHLLYCDCLSSPVYLGLCRGDRIHTASTVQLRKSRRVTTHGADGCHAGTHLCSLLGTLCFTCALENTLTNQLVTHRMTNLKNTFQHVLKIIHIL